MSRKRRTGERPPRASSGTRRQQPVALLVDDLHDTRDMYGEMLRFGGYRVLEASDGADGVAVALEQRPDLIVMDLCMPRMDGWEAIRRLKSDPLTRSIPVVILSAIASRGAPSDLACEAYLVKPCLPLDLLGVVDTLLASSETERKATVA